MSGNLKTMLTTLVVGSLAFGCSSSSTGPNSNNLTVRFRSGLSAGNASAVASAGGASASAAQALSIAGTNGTLVLDDIRVVVSEFELRVTGTECNGHHQGDGEGNGGGDGETGCGKFETPPAFIAIPLEQDAVPVVQQEVPPGIYSSIAFRVENLRVDDENDNGTELADLLAQIRTEFPDWPDNASMLVSGTFTPTDGTAVPFSVYFSAEIAIKMSLVPPLIVEADGNPGVVDVTVDPRYWFFHGDGTVTDLSAVADGEVVPFEFQMRDGFVRAECHD